MAKSSKEKNKLKEKLVNKYRLVIIDENTFEEKISFKLSRLNVFITVGLFSFIVISLTFSLIAFTSLREYIPGHSSVAMKRKISKMAYTLDSLERVHQVNTLYIDQVKTVLKGEVKEFEFDTDSVFDAVVINHEGLKPTARDSAFRAAVEEAEKYSLISGNKKDLGITFFTPVSGLIKRDFNLSKKDLGIDIAVKKGTPVKAIADGVVLFAEWTLTQGNVVIIEHVNGFISVYTHNSSLLKSQGDKVVSGEVIASSGASGELNTGDYLHFELWSDGNPVDPKNFIDFE